MMIFSLACLLLMLFSDVQTLYRRCDGAGGGGGLWRNVRPGAGLLGPGTRLNLSPRSAPLSFPASACWRSTWRFYCSWLLQTSCGETIKNGLKTDLPRRVNHLAVSKKTHDSPGRNASYLQLHQAPSRPPQALHPPVLKQPWRYCCSLGPFLFSKCSNVPGIGGGERGGEDS